MARGVSGRHSVLPRIDAQGVAYVVSSRNPVVGASGGRSLRPAAMPSRGAQVQCWY
jgi:hypothetical protein